MSIIFYNGHILTMEDENAEIAIKNAPEAILVKRGKIEQIGSLEELKKIAGKRIKYHDLKGRCLMPAFIDPHSHFLMNAKMSLCVDLSECNSFESIVETLQQYIESKGITEKNGVFGYGYDHNFLSEFAHPDKRILDRVSRTIPIFILHVSAHLACANSAALKISEIHEDTIDPPGGRIGRLEDGREPSGYLEEAALSLVQTKVGRLLKKDIKSLMSNMQKIYLQHGITTVQDGATTITDFKLLQILSRLHILKLDVVAYPLMTADGVAAMKKYGGKYRNYQGRIKIGGYKIVLDGSPQGRTAWMSEPYERTEDYRGYAWLSDSDVEKYVKIAVEEQKQLLAHCNGDAASEQFLNAYEKAVASTPQTENLRPVMIHCQTVRNDQIERMAKIGMIASIFVGHVWYWGDVHMLNFGKVRGEHISPVNDALMRGVVVNFHQDTPVTKPDMLHSVWCAANRISRAGKIIGENQKICVYDALKAVTVNAAYEYFEEDVKGTIRKGKRADFVILDKSPIAVSVAEVKDIEVLETIKDGRSVYIK